MNIQQDRSKLLAFLLNFVPGLGHYYYKYKVRGFIYGFMFFALLGFGFLLFIGNASEELGLLSVLGAGFIWFISMFDMVVKLLREPEHPVNYPPGYTGYMPNTNGYGHLGHTGEHNLDPDHPLYGMPHGQGPGMEPPFGFPPPEGYVYPNQGKGRESERFFTILLSFIPGLGHLHLGLLQRGLSFLIGFFGLAIMLIFVAAISGKEVILLFLLLLPVMWLYSMFDAVQHVHRKQAGEILEDKTLFEQLEHGRSHGKRSKVIATLLAAFPGAGQMYLGLQKRGLQLMLLFFGSIYILDLLNLSLFLFLIPIIWFYSFFDGLQLSSKYGREPLLDRPVIEGWNRYQGWIGAALLFLGIYYILLRLVVPELENRFESLQIFYSLQSYMNTIVVSLLLIGGGLKLLFSPKRKEDEGERLLRELERDMDLSSYQDRE
ncbi:multi-tm2 domain protein [Paenibacillus sp. Marseille-Q4541]|uniref:multi-tm2 domain protein n=1 Tax=Paenibacillus sp. Marseille-Q4541 TaxID=2831522 RepID=UPI0020169633|nr:multi-tm2 domain protein [Paenibacillus sp. Marseille-Q4541]